MPARLQHRQESERFAKRVGGSPNLGGFRQVKNPGGFGTLLWVI